MLRNLLALAGLLLSCSYCVAQKKDSLPSGIPTSLPNEWMVKFSPLSIFETDGGICFTGEYLLSKPRLGLQLEVQPILFDIYSNNGSEGFETPDGVIQSGAPRGIKLRPELRLYMGGIDLSDRPPRAGSRRARLDLETQRLTQSRTYIAVDFLYKYVDRQRLNEFDIVNGGTQAAYRQRATYDDIKQVTGFDFKFGIVTPTSSPHWITDFYIGFGIRSKKFWYRNIPAGATPPGRNTFSLFGEDNSLSGSNSGTLPSFPFGFKITYRF